MNFYSILGVEVNADTNTIKKAFRSKLKIHHPDTQYNEEEPANSENAHTKQDSYTLINIINAYDVLSNPIKRRHYDLNSGYMEHSDDYFVKTQSYNKRKSKVFDYEAFLYQRQHIWEYKIKYFVYDLMMKDGKKSIEIYEHITSNNLIAKLKTSLGFYDYIDCMFLLAESYQKKPDLQNKEKALNLYYEIGLLETQKKYFGIFMEEIAEQVLQLLTTPEGLSSESTEKLLKSMKTWKLKKKYTNRINKILSMVSNDM